MSRELNDENVIVPRKMLALVVSMWSGYLEVAEQRKFYPPTSHNAIAARALLAELASLIDSPDHEPDNPQGAWCCDSHRLAFNARFDGGGIE